jgi:hypothetical protein
MTDDGAIAEPAISTELESDPSAVNEDDGRGITALHWVVTETEGVRILPPQNTWLIHFPLAIATYLQAGTHSTHAMRWRSLRLVRVEDIESGRLRHNVWFLDIPPHFGHWASIWIRYSDSIRFW